MKPIAIKLHFSRAVIIMGTLTLKSSFSMIDLGWCDSRMVIETNSQTNAKLCVAQNDNPHIRKALEIMAEQYAQPLSVKNVAQAIGLSPNYLSMLFKQVVGIGFREQLNQIRVKESKRLLRSSNCSLTEISIAMGFADQSYFCKVFKRMTGLSPSQYRAGI